MERVSFDIDRAEVYDALRAEAAAHGRSVSEEVATLVKKTYAAKVAVKSNDDDNWVADLVALAKKIDLPNGLDPYLPPRRREDFEPPKL